MRLNGCRWLEPTGHGPAGRDRFGDTQPIVGHVGARVWLGFDSLVLCFEVSNDENTLRDYW